VLLAHKAKHGTRPIFKVGLQQGFAAGEMGIDQIALQNS